MNKLQVGYAQVNINPPLGIGILGYFKPRYAKGFLDDLEASVLALSIGQTPVLLFSVDVGGLRKYICDRLRKAISEVVPVPETQIFLTATHTHTGPLLEPSERFESDENLIRNYVDFLQQRLCDLAVMAIADMRPAKMGVGQGLAPDRIAYIRRYKMKDGTTMTCPPINDPNIDHPIGQLDQRVHVLRFDREDAQSVVILNYGVHADTVNGEMISSDWPGWTRRTVEAALGAKCMCIVGAEGDVGSTHVNPVAGDMNDTEISFDNEMKSPGMARFVGRALAGTVLQVFDKVAYVDVDRVQILHKTVVVDANKPKPEDMPRAREYTRLHNEGRDDLIPYTAMELTTVLAEAYRMCRLENGPDQYFLDLTGLQIGNVAMIGIPGEPFTGIGVGIKDTEGWGAILPCCLTNGHEGYFPMRDAFEEGGYEARGSVYVSGVAEAIIEGAKNLLKDLKA